MIISAGISRAKAGPHMERGPGFPHWSAGFFLSGLTEIVCGEHTWQLPGRHAVILPPNTAYTLALKKRQHEIWMIFDPRPHLLEALQAKRGGFAPFTVSFPDPGVWTRVRTGLSDLLTWWGAQTPRLRLAENAMEKVLLLARWSHDQQHENVADERIQRSIDYIDDRLGKELSVEELARVAGLSGSRFSHLFRERTGLTPMKFLEMRRIERARHLLLTSDLPVQQIGLSTGFPNAQHFSIRFRKLTGQSPSAFRHLPKRRFRELHPEEEDAPS